MADQRILYTENMVGANHPTLADTLNRMSMVAHENDGTHKFVLDTTDASSSTTGALKTAGGLGVAKKAFIGTDLSVGGHATLEGVTSTGATGTGKLVFDTSPTLVTPVIGAATATSINKTAITAPATGSTLAVADGKTFTASNTMTLTATDGANVVLGGGGSVIYTTNKISDLNTTSSAELASKISDETGSGALVFANSPTLVTPALGTPSSGTLTNCTFPVASTTVSGTVKIDGTTIGITNGVISAIGSGTGTVTSVTAGAGLTQSGTATVNPTLDVVSHAGSAGTIGTLTVGADSVGVDLGTTGTTAAAGNHLHTGVYEPADATILKSAAIGVSVQAYDATILNSASIGVSVQAYDADLTTWAGKTAPTGTVVGTSDSQTLTNKTLEAASLTNGYTEEVYNLTGTEINPTNGSIQYKTLSGNTTFTEALADGQSVTLMLNPATYTTTWPTTTWIGSVASTAPTLVASVYNCITFFQFGGTLYGKYEGRV